MCVSVNCNFVIFIIIIIMQSYQELLKQWLPPPQLGSGKLLTRDGLFVSGITQKVMGGFS